MWCKYVAKCGDEIPILQRGALHCKMQSYLCFYMSEFLWFKCILNIYVMADIKDLYKMIYWHGAILAETLAKKLFVFFGFFGGLFLCGFFFLFLLTDSAFWFLAKWASLWQSNRGDEM